MSVEPGNVMQYHTIPIPCNTTQYKSDTDGGLSEKQGSAEVKLQCILELESILKNARTYLNVAYLL